MSKRIHFGKYINLAGKILGTLVIASPVIASAQQSLPSGDFQGFLNGTVARYTGYNIENQNFDYAQLGGGVAAVAGGIFIIKLFSWIGKKVN